GLDSNRGAPNCILCAKRVLSGTKHHLSESQLRGKQIVRFARPNFIGRTVGINPRNTVIGTSQKLQLCICNLCGTPELSVPPWCALVVFNESRCWCEPGQRHV